MDNRKIDIQSEGFQAFSLAMKLHFDNSPSKKASHYAEDDGDLIFLWSDKDNKEGVKEIPFQPMSSDVAAEFAWRWLESRTHDQRKGWIDHDGDMGNGFRTFCDGWGKDKKYRYGFVRIQAIFAWYGK